MLFSWLITVACLAIASLLFLYFSIKSHQRNRTFLLAIYSSCTCISTVIVIAIISAGLSLHTFQRLSLEEHVAELAIEQTAPKQYLIRLFLTDKPAQVFHIQGDEWLIDARILKWQPWVNLLGLHTLYRLERLSSRYSSTDHAKYKPRSVISLIRENSEKTSIDIVPNWLPLVDANYGNSTYMPLGHGARYRVSITTSGLISRPINQKAKLLLQNWL